MKAALLVQRRVILSSREFAEIVIWEVPKPVPGSRHSLKYRLAFVVDGECVLRYDNETGKGDHRHLQGVERAYRFTDIDALMSAFEADVARLRK